MEAHLCVCNNSYLIFVRNFEKKWTGTPFRFKKKNRNAVPVRSGPIWTLSVTQHGDLVLYALRYPQPMKANERIIDVIGALQVEDQPCRRVQHRLESAQEVGWNADQHAVVVVQPGVHQSDDQHLD